jgi:hypothetical protein
MVPIDLELRDLLAALRVFILFALIFVTGLIGLLEFAPKPARTMAAIVWAVLLAVVLEVVI